MKNNDIRFELDIKADRGTIFNAFTTKKGYQGWWSTTCEINCNVGQESFIRFEKEDRIEEMGFTAKEVGKNEKLVWVCFSNNVFSSWIGTELCFEITEKGLSSCLVFTHHSIDPAWRKHTDYRPSVSGWDYFMGSLKNYCETGIGDPWVAG